MFTVIRDETKISSWEGGGSEISEKKKNSNTHPYGINKLSTKTNTKNHCFLIYKDQLFEIVFERYGYFSELRYQHFLELENEYFLGLEHRHFSELGNKYFLELEHPHFLELE